MTGQVCSDPNEVYETCGLYCGPMCSNHRLLFPNCVAPPQGVIMCGAAGCYCKSGFIRDGQTCIPINECKLNWLKINSLLIKIYDSVVNI